MDFEKEDEHGLITRHILDRRQRMLPLSNKLFVKSIDSLHGVTAGKVQSIGKNIPLGINVALLLQYRR